MEWKGLITICDRCGAECRRRYTKTEDMDGGFTKIDNFTPLEAGWKYRDVGALCPTCEQEYQETISAFMKAGKEKHI